MDYSKFMGLITLQVVLELFLGPKKKNLFFFSRIFYGKKRTSTFKSNFETFYAKFEEINVSISIEVMEFHNWDHNI
jgi:hypothetical protein